MISSRQYVSCRFNPADTRTYTYHNDADPVSPGDIVKVADNRDPDSWKRVEVVSVSALAPSFPTKPIIGLVDQKESAE